MFWPDKIKRNISYFEKVEKVKERNLRSLCFVILATSFAFYNISEIFFIFVLTILGQASFIQTWPINQSLKIFLEWQNTPIDQTLPSRLFFIIKNDVFFTTFFW